MRCARATACPIAIAASSWWPPAMKKRRVCVALPTAPGRTAYRSIGSPVDSIALRAGVHVVRMRDGSELEAGIVVNSASLHAPALARRFEGLDARFIPREHFAKGNYYSLTGKAPFTRLIYPAPADT